MKVKITKRSKEILKIAELPAAKAVIESVKEEDIKDYAPIAANIAMKRINGYNLGYSPEILKADAEIVKNCRVWDRYCDGSGNIDIWITIYAYDSYYGFYDIGVYLTDIWESTGENAAEIAQHMYINGFSRNGHKSPMPR